MSGSHESNKRGEATAACEETATPSSPAPNQMAVDSAANAAGGSTLSSAAAPAPSASVSASAGEPGAPGDPGDPASPAREPEGSAVAEASPEASPEPSFAHASHAALFAQPEAALCDVCGAPVRDDEDGEDGENGENAYAIPGRGLYVWSRGDERRLEEPPLCPACAAAIGVSAMARWEIEEEEG